MNYVLVEKLSRLSRNITNLVDTLNFLEENNVFLKSLSDGIDTAKPIGRNFIMFSQTLLEMEQEFIKTKKITNEKGVELL